MRRTREWTLEHYIIAAVPVLVVVVGIYHWTHRGPADSKAAKEAKDAHEAKPAVSEQSEHKVASEPEHESESTNDHGKRAKHANAEHKSEDEAFWDEPEDGHHPSKALQRAANEAVAEGSDCAAIEYRGDGPTLTKVTKGEWTIVMDQFHSAKDKLASWLTKHKGSLADDTAKAMERQLRALKIQRPPVSDEPDLSWRGIGVYSQSPEGEPIVKLGGGFVALAINHPTRAKFEITRLVAQVWAPCELQRISALDATWAPMLKCLGVTEKQDCGQGTYSESGWAISTAVAAAVSAPGCEVPAFRAPEVARCVKAMPFSRTVASAHEAPVASPAAVTEKHENRAIAADHKTQEHKVEEHKVEEHKVEEHKVEEHKAAPAEHKAAENHSEHSSKGGHHE